MTVATKAELAWLDIRQLLARSRNGSRPELMHEAMSEATYMHASNSCVSLNYLDALCNQAFNTRASFFKFTRKYVLVKN